MTDRSVVERATRETRIRLEVQRGKGEGDITTGVPFLDHMMVAFARYAGLDVMLRAEGCAVIKSCILCPAQATPKPALPRKVGVPRRSAP